jgi:hypothetical protein
MAGLEIIIFIVIASLMCIAGVCICYPTIHEYVRHMRRRTRTVSDDFASSV